MIENIATVPVIVIVIVAIVAIFTAAFLIARSSNYREITDLVLAAEQMLGDAPGAEKLEWVIGRVQEHLPGLNPVMMRAMIEAAVYRLKRRRGDGSPG